MRNVSIALSIAACFVVASAGCKSMGDHEEDDEKGEVKISYADAPQPVKDTLAKEAPGASIATLDKEDKHGQTIYEADAMIGGKNWEICVAPDGTLVKKKLDEEDEKNEKAEK